MYCRTAASFSHPTGSSDRYKWDPETVLGLINPSNDSITCVGYAASRGRRCQNRVAAASVRCARSMIDKLALENAYKAAASPQLEVAASLLLCKRFHSNQTPDVAESWRSKLEDWAERHEDVKPSFQAGDQQSDLDASDTAAEDSDSDESSDDDDVKPRAKNERKMDSHKKCSNEELMKMMKQMQENLAWLNAELTKRNAKLNEEVKVNIKLEEKEEDDKEQTRIQKLVDERWMRHVEELRRQKQEEEQRRREEEEEERRQEEQKRQEAERKRREEEGLRQKREQERRRREEEAAAEAARTRAFQERVRLTRQRWEREQRKRAEEEAAEWRAAWEKYNKTWDSDRASAANIPWPVKLGLRGEVNEASVRLFFAKAPPEESRATARARFDLVSRELRRWHTDKVMNHLGLGAVNSLTRDALNTVAKVLVELRKDARREMNT
ncbi:hypothetical protein F4809DRAFT_632800 [Biscogniauxia mediterranea]|nr:hypothetical protein F4809DRAFT_632800 [Biscogniauxia mediterranea]